MNIHDISKQIRAFADELDAVKATEQPNDSPPWIEHKGGPCPLRDDEVEEWEWRVRSGLETGSLTVRKPSSANWNHTGSLGDIIAYRVLKARKPAPKQPLGPSDVPPGSVLRMNGRNYWVAVIHAGPTSVSYHTGSFNEVLGYDKLQDEGWQINRPKHRDADGNPTLWEACER